MANARQLIYKIINLADQHFNRYRNLCKCTENKTNISNISTYIVLLLIFLFKKARIIPQVLLSTGGLMIKQHISVGLCYTEQNPSRAHDFIPAF